MRRRRPLLSATVVLGLLVAGCRSTNSSPSAGLSRAWLRVEAGALGPAGAPTRVASALPSGEGWPWLVAGDTSSAGVPAVGFWLASDGVSWKRAATQGLTLDAPQSLVFSMARRGSVSVALGETPGMAHGNPRPTIWRSTDGNRWAEVPTLREDFGGPYLTDLVQVTAGPRGFAVVGNWMTVEGIPVIAVWLSSDGLHWVRHDHVAELTSVGPEELTAMGVAAGPAGFAVVGESYAPTAGRADRVVGFIAVSEDGIDWHRVPTTTSGLDNGGQVALRSVAADDGSFIALGTRSRGPKNELSVWQPARQGTWSVSTLASVPFPQATVAAVDGLTIWAAIAAGGQVMLWSRGAGMRWDRVEAPSVAGASSVVLAAAGGHLVVADQEASRAQLWFS